MVQSLVYLLCRTLIGALVRNRRSRVHLDLEIVVLRHQLRILKRQNPRPLIKPSDRAFMAAAARRLKRPSRSLFVVTPRTVLRWHQKLVALKWARYTKRRLKVGRPQLPEDIQNLILRIARENPRWGYTRVQGEVANLGIEVSPTAVRNLLRRNGIGPAPRNDMLRWSEFLSAHAKTILACDFFTVETLFLRRLYVLFFIEFATRKIHIAGSTRKPNREWVTQQARNLFLADQAPEVSFLIRDRDSKFARSFDDIFQTEGIEVVKIPYRTPVANAVAERCVKTLRNECLDRLLIVGQRHLNHVLEAFARHYNAHRPHRTLGQASPLHITDSSDSEGTIARRQVLGGLINEYYRQAA